jgi:hypothetical protein
MTFGETCCIAVQGFGAKFLICGMMLACIKI